MSEVLGVCLLSDMASSGCCRTLEMESTGVRAGSMAVLLHGLRKEVRMARAVCGSVLRAESAQSGTPTAEQVEYVQQGSCMRRSMH